MGDLVVRVARSHESFFNTGIAGPEPGDFTADRILAGLSSLQAMEKTSGNASMAILEM